ncbi:adenine nucleotide alpha hydrolases-like protein [Meredithblackwellia eburnea MCA 4105]
MSSEQLLVTTITKNKKKFTAHDAAAVYNFSSPSFNHSSQQDKQLAQNIRTGLHIIEKAINTYGKHHLALSFNGGKDCTVLLHLLASVLLHTNPTSSRTFKIPTLYIRCTSPFPQVESFVTQVNSCYSLDLVSLSGSMKDVLARYLVLRQQQQQQPSDSDSDSREIKAVLVGTRRTDPHGGQLAEFEETNGDWPRFMRVHPVLDWGYGQIWDFLRHPYLTLGALSPPPPPPTPLNNNKETTTSQIWCSLYNVGYTSLGSTHNTFPNPELRVTNEGTGEVEWRPAWELKDAALERAGRESRAKILSNPDLDDS